MNAVTDILGKGYFKDGIVVVKSTGTHLHLPDTWLIHPYIRPIQFTPLSPADFNQDGKVDQADFDEFQNCKTAPGITQQDPAKQKADLDKDGDIDQDDFAIFQREYTG